MSVRLDIQGQVLNPQSSANSFSLDLDSDMWCWIKYLTFLNLSSFFSEMNSLVQFLSLNLIDILAWINELSCALKDVSQYPWPLQTRLSISPPCSPPPTVMTTNKNVCRQSMSLEDKIASPHHLPLETLIYLKSFLQDLPTSKTVLFQTTCLTLGCFVRKHEFCCVFVTVTKGGIIKFSETK